jgi:hypothetical protein
MTELIYHSLIYKNYVKSKSIINDLELRYIKEIISFCSPTDLFVNSIWGEVDNNLIELIKQKPSRAIVYSGMDWENTVCKKDFHEFINKHIKNTLYIGNSEGIGYFSFWLFFIEKYYKSYPIEQIELNNPKYLYMCLNRKRHPHRVKLVERLKEENLLRYGLVSLGGDREKNIPQLDLDIDIKTTDGNKATNFGSGDIPNDISSIGDLTNWNSTLINVVTETTTHTHTFISEKTWKPIIGLRPFMIVGDYKIYSYLKDYGIDTFDDVFGTGYEHPWVHRRIEWVISNLKKYSNTNLIDLYKDLYPRLVKNKLQLQEIFKINSSKYQKVINLIKINSQYL